MPLLAGSISFQDAHSGSGLIPLFRRRLFEILEFISTLISACRPMSSGLSQAALRSCASCAAFGNWFRRLSISHWSLPLSYHITDVLAVFTGYEHPNALSSSWRLSSTELFMVSHLSTYRISCSRVPVKLKLSDVQDAKAFNFRRPVMPRHQNLGVHSH